MFFIILKRERKCVMYIKYKSSVFCIARWFIVMSNNSILGESQYSVVVKGAKPGAWLQIPALLSTSVDPQVGLLNSLLPHLWTGNDGNSNNCL